ncbi:class I mannose-6-phosphate isomerase [Phytoactinopolyspora alkaliphila]|uniref:class I mannose-6-phosphate isomerase n=1 Tax=Phytoactinopolyspora alkaliphila TaxID=1783498 RepID=UPI001C20B0FC|nr:class I mannose-6-phosphate isomerase [Phytoactinopolyspora alkaliphila]
MHPLLLGPNLPPTFYRGAGRIADFRSDRFGVVPRDRPEDWIASTVSRFGERSTGLTELPEGGYLREAVDAAPEQWLGPDAAEWSSQLPRPSLLVPLVKFLDAGQRLPVHVHPDDTFARSRLGAAQGKTEAWVIMEAPADALVYLGWRQEMPVDRLADLVERQDVTAMLAAMNAVTVRAGDVVLVPAGTPHAIGQGIFLTEVQQAADLSILLEWQPFLADPEQAFGGATPDVALDCVDVAPLGADVVDELVVRGVLERSSGAGRSSLMPDAADGFFALLLRDGGTLAAGYSTMVVLGGRGTLAGEDWTRDVERGMTLAVPYAAGPVRVSGEVSVAAFTPGARRTAVAGA